MPPRPRSSRRQFLKRLGATALGLGLYTWRIEPHWVEVVDRILPVAGLPSGLEGKTLLQLSDLHVSQRVDRDYLKRSLDLASSLGPDLTVITGDLMSSMGHEQIENVVEVLSHLRPGPLGAFAILGNHDYTYGWTRPDVADALAARLESIGIRTLRNEQTQVAGLQLVGIDDLWTSRFAPQQVIPHVDWSLPTITLCHNPDAVDLPELAPVKGWILAGHTHGGQCKPPFLPPPVLSVKNRRYTAGEFSLTGDRTMYINRGLGYIRRVRFNARPEITLHRLTAARQIA